ncbi:MAG: S8 family serine peptidase [Gammaproteobacteria bacterium]
MNQPSLADSVPSINGDYVWNEGYTGQGQSVAILDTGVESTHSFFADSASASRIVSEACYSTTSVSNSTTALCSDGSTAAGSGANCTGISGCNHGTHVAGIAAGKNSSLSGVAPDAPIIAIQVFSKVNDANFCGSSSACLAAYDSDIIQGLERVYALASGGSFDIAAANLSLGGGNYSDVESCDAENSATKAIIDDLRSIGVATVIASGNDGSGSKISSPGCISSAVSVGSTNDSGVISSFSNSASWLTLLAPGSGIYSSSLNNGFTTMSGTSMATPHVTGSFALLKSKSPNATVEQVLVALVGGGTHINDTRNTMLFPRVDLREASYRFDAVYPPAIVTLDNSFHGAVTGGSFSSLNQTDSYFGTFLESTATAGSTYHFVPQLPQAGDYKVYAWWPSSSSFSPQARFSVSHDNTTHTVEVNQQGNGHEWYELGVFTFNANGFEYVDLSNPNGGIIAADALRFELMLIEPLVVETITLPNGFVDNIYNASLIATGGTAPYSWQIASGALPAGLSLASNGDISGTPSQAGTANVTVRVTDAHNTIASRALSITIASNASSATVFQADFAGGDLSAWSQLKAGSLVAVNDPSDGWVVRKTGSNDPNGGFAALGQSLNDFELTLYTRKVNTNGGSLNRYSLTDGNGNGYGINLAMTANYIAIEKRSIWNSSTIKQSATVSNALILNQWYTVRFTRQGNNLYAGVYAGKVNPATATPLFEITGADATFSNITQFNINGGYEFDTDDIQILNSNNALPTLTVATTSLPNGTVATTYGQSLAASGGTAPYSWQIVSGALPAGLSLASNGNISGTPSQAETANFTVQVTDADNNTASQALSLTIDSNVSATPAFQANFAGGDLSAWSQLKSGSLMAVNDPSDGWVVRKTGSNDPNGGFATLGQSLNDFELTLYTRKVNTNGGSLNRYSLTDGNGNGYGINLAMTANYIAIEKRSVWNANTIKQSATVSNALTMNQWYTVRFTRQGSILYAAVYTGKVDPAAATPLFEISATDATFNNITQFNINGGYEFDTDDIVVFP